MKSVRLGLMTALLAGYLLHTKAQIDLEPSKIFEKVIFKGYVQLNILMVGQSGTGKTSCVNSLFNSTVIPKKDAVMKSTNKMTLYRRLLPFKHVDMDLVSPASWCVDNSNSSFCSSSCDHDLTNSLDIPGSASSTLSAMVTASISKKNKCPSSR